VNASLGNLGESGLRGHTVLIIDDESANLGVMSDYLEGFGLGVLIARDGESGLERAQYAQPDLILLDVLMPGMDGFETCQRLKADEIARNIPVIFMTALAGTADKVKGFQLGAVDYVTKPFQYEEVLVRVSTHLRLRELTERLEQKVRERTEELSKANRAYKALSECNQALVHATEEGELLQEVCRIIMEDCGYRLVWIGFAEHDQAKTVRPVAQAGYEEGYLDTVDITWADTERGRGPTGTAIRTGKPIVNKDVLTHPDYAPWRAEAARRGYASSAAFPLLTGTGEAIGALNIYATQPDAFAIEEVNLLMELAQDLAYGIVSLRVQAERERVEEALRESEELHRITIENILDPVFITDDDGQFTFVCANIPHTLGYTVEEMQAMGNVSKLVGDGLFDLEELETLGEIRNIERIIADKHGRERSFLITVKRVSIRRGTILYTCHDITERKWAEMALRESEARHRNLFEGVPVGIYRTTPTGQFLDANPALVQILGYPDRESLLARNTTDLYVSHETREQWQALMVPEGIVREFEAQIHKHDGTAIWVKEIGRSVRGTDGRVLYYEGSLEDITERKRMERLVEGLNAAGSAMQRALTQDEIFTALAEELKKLNSHCLIFTLDESRSKLTPKYISFDEAVFGTVEKLVGVRREGRGFPVKDVDICRDAIWERKAVFVDGDGVKKTARQVLPEPAKQLAGKVVEMLGVPKFIAAPLVAEDQVIGVLSVHSDDLDESDTATIQIFAHQVTAAWRRAQFHEQVQQHVRDLTILNEISGTIVSSLNMDEVLTKAIAGAKTMLNAEAASVLLYDAAGDELVFAAAASPVSEALIGTRIPATAGVAGWVLRKAQSALIRDAQTDPRFYDQIDVLTGMTTHSLLAVPLRHKENITGVVEAVNKVGKPFDEHDLELFTALANSVAGAIENARLYQTEQEQRRLVEQSQAQLVLSEKLAATGRLAASLAHEINNPLQIIHNSLRIMRTIPLEPDKQQEYLQMADGEVERLMNIVTRILEFARPSRRETQLVDVNDAIEKTLALTNKYLQHQDVVVQRDLVSNLPPVAVSPDELQQVFLNIVLNAVDAMPGGGTLCISSQLVNGERLAVSFSDSGIGIPPEYLDRLFEPFFSTKEGGTGLGLSISYSTVERCGGEITVQSEIGKGATFTVWLPAAE
jgi:PAS domain S-box-containing protein